MQITCIWPENITSDWNVKRMLRDKGNMRRGKKYACFPRSVGPTISEVVKGWWGKGLGGFEKYIHVCTVYPGSAYRARKESCISALSKKTPHAPTVGWKKKNLPEMLPGLTWSMKHEAYDFSQKRSFAGTFEYSFVFENSLPKWFFLVTQKKSIFWSGAGFSIFSDNGS